LSLTQPQYTVSTWDPSSSSEDIHSLWSKALPSLEPAYAIPAEKLHSLLVAPSARVFVAASPSTPTLGFALTYTIRSGSATMPSGQHLKGGLSMLIVDPSHRNRGIGSALHDAALSYLTKAVRDSLTRSDPPAKEGSIILGSVFPRIFPGVPDGPEFEPARQWFEKRGWAFGKDKSIDLYRTIVPGDQLNREMEPLLQRATDHGMRFGAPLASDDAALYALQKKEFDGFTVSPVPVRFFVLRGLTDMQGMA
jgi:beta-N-acetylhexosaminidase